MDVEKSKTFDKDFIKPQEADTADEGPIKTLAGPRRCSR